MTENDTTPEPTPIVCEFLESARQFKALSESVRAANKKALFDALEAAGISSVTVAFDGCGDSGQIEDIVVEGATTQLPVTPIEIALVQWGQSGIARPTQSVRDAVETLAYDFLEQTHGGWENNEGAYGEFTFDVGDRTIRLDYNERIETSEYTQHNF